MADIYNLEIVAMGNNTNADPTKLLIDENQVQGAILGKLTGFAPGEDVSKLTFAPSNVAGGNGDSSGRFGLMKVTNGGVTEWLLYVKDAREFNHEYSFGEFEDILNELTFAASSALGDYTATLSIELRDLNEAPEDIVFSGAQPVQVGMAAGSNVPKATASDDPDINNPDGFGINEYVFKNGTDSGQFSIDPSGLFRIHKTTGQITTADALDSGDAGVHDLFVQIRDTTNPNVFREEKVPVTVTANTAPGAVAVAPARTWAWRRTRPL